MQLKLMLCLIVIAGLGCSGDKGGPTEPGGPDLVTYGVAGRVYDTNSPATGLRVGAFIQNVADGTHVQITGDGNGELARTELTSSRIGEQYRVVTFQTGSITIPYEMIDKIVPYLSTVDPATGRKTLYFDIALQPVR
jgi:hypothetical protein